MQSKKKNSSPTVWHNSLAKSRSNLHQESWEKQNYACALPPIEKLTSGILLYSLFLFHPPTYRKQRWQPRSARAYMRVGRWVLPSFYFCQVGLSNCWGPVFLVFAKIIWMPSCFDKLLELLLDYFELSHPYFFLKKLINVEQFFKLDKLKSW
jgi:hypothetical protein